MALVNLRPIVPGHVLVVPKAKDRRRLRDLDQDEVCDLFLTCQRVSRMLERVFEASSMTLAVQDGVQAGQSVPHTHVHLLPRRADDFRENDEVYGEIETHERGLGRQGLDSERRDRSMDEMDREARWLEGEMVKEMDV